MDKADLEAIARLNKIAVNLREMERILDSCAVVTNNHSTNVKNSLKQL